ncbi:Protein ECM19 [Lachancea thermotolerans]|uniref:KLTH0D14300p n=1 Tax=Lachancea thermotolerans (strain ATCC 56472 / CBS 6340 / NRRL Y-8284) TaxID=559295 RepID=C5DFD8_LACTC|nr:KLTH0D14300p [Lachancea thermotolerans CBS 6340]CAR22893.1 KLTH0D14300p [Lachancea thermotolerans CBS 6340]
MPRIKAFDVIAFSLVTFVGIYTGTQFFEPIIIERLKKDNNLRSDIDVPQYDEEGNPLSPKSMLDLRKELEKVQESQKAEQADSK